MLEVQACGWQMQLVEGESWEGRSVEDEASREPKTWQPGRSLQHMRQTSGDVGAVELALWSNGCGWLDVQG
jgi:hypothetical protein